MVIPVYFLASDYGDFIRKGMRGQYIKNPPFQGIELYPEKRRFHTWRRAEDSNPWGLRPVDFKSTTIDRSDSPPA